MAEGRIYGLSLDGRNFRYIGLTVQPLWARLQGHVAASRYDDKMRRYPVLRWIRKHGPDKIVITELEECDVEVLDEREIYWIAEMKRRGHQLLNLAPGGYGLNREYWTPETRSVHSARLKRYFSDPEKVEAMRQRQRDGWTDERRAAKSHTTKKYFEANPDKRALDNARLVATSGRGRHTRWHTNRGIVSSECEYCA